MLAVYSVPGISARALKGRYDYYLPFMDVETKFKR